MNVSNVDYNLYFAAKSKYDSIPRDVLADMLKKGFTYEHIGRSLGVPLHVVSRFVKTFGLISSRKEVFKRNALKVKQLHEQGYDDIYIAKNIPTTISNVKKVLAKDVPEPSLLDQIVKKLNIDSNLLSKYLK